MWYFAREWLIEMNARAADLLCKWYVKIHYSAIRLQAMSYKKLKYLVQIGHNNLNQRYELYRLQILLDVCFFVFCNITI